MKTDQSRSTASANEQRSETISGRIGLFFENVGRVLMERPIWFAMIVVLALALLPVAVFLDLRHHANVSLTRQVTDLNSMISQIRSYYSRNVVGRILDNDGESTPAHNYAEIDGGVPIPATLSIELGSVIGGESNNIKYRFVSDNAFSNRVPHRLDEFETFALSTLRNSGKADANVIEVVGSGLHQQIRMAVPIVMGTACVACHNTHPESPKRDWKVGDVRGIQSITLDQPIAGNILSFKYLLLYLFGAGSFGVGFAALQWWQAVQFSRVNNELEEGNEFLASISLKISKYLSPQVYKSIFSGERDAVISTERKKLTIFFSDIKDFTATSERLQPEELTELLNQYFTEMSKIALDHGATIDKFIGDAILAFFGDPETKGSHEDAQACLNMALAMQERMTELNIEWRRAGIETPFRCRMGINTGYCNVGNFGSKDRMDYTIIGAEANLAARLESIAEPGGIVMSYETYSLVQNSVRARALEPISLKGISRQVVPYVVEDIRRATQSGRSNAIDQKTSRLRLHVDLVDLVGEECKEIENALASALVEVQRRREQDA